MSRVGGAVAAAACALGTLAAVVWFAQSGVSAQLGLPAGVRAWTSAAAWLLIALVAIPLVTMIWGERRR
jgi:hypothetical protein